MLNDYLSIKEEYNGFIYISNLLHDIKYNKDIGDLYAKYSDIDLSGINNFDKCQFTELCVLATYIEQAFNNRGMPGPDWVYDKRLFLETPYFNGFKTESAVLHATQACLNHNVFMNRGDFEVY